MSLTKSKGNDIEVLAANGLSIFFDVNDSELKLKDTNGNIQPVMDFLANITDTALYYGSFLDTSTQTTTGGEQKAMTLNTTILSQGISIQNNSQIKVNHAGVYNLQFSAQVVKTQGGSSETIYIYLRKNGTNIVQSNTAFTFQNNNSFSVLAWNFVESLNANDYLELMWYTTDQHIQIAKIANPVVGLPDIPSLILTMNRVG